MKKIYLTYNTEELAQDQDFIRWAQDPQGRAHAAWETWLQDHPDQVQKVSEAKKLVQAIQWPMPELGQQRKDNLWAKIDQNTSTQTAKPTLSVFRIWLPRVAAVAAAFFIGIAIWWSFDGFAASPTIVQAAEGQINEHQLPDGSQVTLNDLSKVTYQTGNWPQARELQLDGEAFFEVEKGSNFTVHTELGSVQVLGTSFNVEARKNTMRVVCYTGSVMVTGLNGELVILSPNEHVIIGTDTAVVLKIVDKKDIAWQQDLHHFKGIPLGEVFEEFERQFGVKINISNTISERVYTGFFKSNELKDALEAVCWPMQLTYDIDGKQITIQEN